MQSGLLEFEYFKLQAELPNTQVEIVLLKRELDEEKIKSALFEFVDVHFELN